MFRKFGWMFMLLLLHGIESWGQSREIVYQWNFQGKTYTADFSFLRVHYRNYQAQSKKQPYENYLSELQYSPYHLRLARIMDSLSKEAGCKTNLEVASFLLTFAQQAIPYKSDKTISQYNYPKYAVETLVEGWGDCEDKAILCATLFQVFGFNPVLLKYPNHVATGLQCIDCPVHIRSEQQQFAFVESTGKGWKIGDIPAQFQHHTPKIIRPKAGVVYTRLVLHN